MNKWVKRAIPAALATVLTLAVSLFTISNSVAIRVNEGFVSVNIAPNRAEAAITLSTLGTNQNKAATSPWTALSSLSLTAGDYVFVADAADSASSAVSAETAYKDGYTTYPTANNSYSIYLNSWAAEQFTAGSSYTLNGIVLYLGKWGTPSGSVNVSLRAVDASNLPTGSDLSTGSINVSLITGDVELYVTMSSYSIVSGQKYAVVVTGSSGNSSNYAKLYSNSPDPYAGQGSASTNGSSWTADTKDAFFKIYNSAWESVSLTADATGSGTGIVSKIWSGKVSVTSTAWSIIITNTSTAKAMTAYKASGLAASSALDKYNQNNGAGTTATTNTTGTLSQADELVIVASAVEDEIDDAQGTWSTSAGYIGDNAQIAATNGGGDTSNVQCHSAAKVVSANTSVQGSDGTHDSSNWAACIASYKMASAGGTPSVSNSPTSLNMGTLNPSSTYYADGGAPSNPVVDGDCAFTLTVADATATLSISATNWTGGAGWTLTSSAPGSNEVRMTAYYSGQNPASGVVLTTSPQTFKASQAAGTLAWDFKLETGTYTDGSTKTTVITISAAAA